MFVSDSYVASLLEVSLAEVAELRAELGVERDMWDSESIDDAIEILESEDSEDPDSDPDSEDPDGYDDDEDGDEDDDDLDEELDEEE